MTSTNNLPFEWLVGLRYTRTGKRSGGDSFISFISLISTAGIALGVAALIVVLSVMNGFQKDVRDRMLSVLAHVEVLDESGALADWRATAAAARRNPAVRGAAPFAETQALLAHGAAMRPARVRGVLPEQEGQVSDIGRQMRQGRLAALQPGAFRVVLGAGLANALRVRVGDRVTMALPNGTVTPAGVVPRVRQFEVAGIFESGHAEFDAGLAVVHLEDAERLLRLDAPGGVRLRLDDMNDAPRVAAELQRALPGLTVRDWSRQNKSWFGAVQTEKTMMFIILTLIIAVAAFNLVSTLVMTVTDKRADIAILRTLGASPASVMRIFMIQGGLVGLLGTLGGVALGVLVALNVDVIVPFIEAALGVQFLPRDVYVNTRMPSDLRWPDVGAIAGVAVLLAFVATLYPSWSASRVRPAEALRYE